MIFDSIILKLKGIMYLVYSVVSKIHLFIFLLKVATLPSGISIIFFVKFIFSAHILLLWVRARRSHQRGKNPIKQAAYITFEKL
jgi:predicted neutral ceramidase superfamily lipid hydrolase